MPSPVTRRALGGHEPRPLEPTERSTVMLVGRDAGGLGRRLRVEAGWSLVNLSYAEACARVLAAPPQAVVVDLSDVDSALAVARDVAARLPEVRIVGLCDADIREDLAPVLAHGFASLIDVRADLEEVGRALQRTLAGERAVTTDLVPRLLEQLGQSALRPQFAEPAQDTPWFREPGALRSVFQPIADVRDRKVVAYLTLTRFPGLPGLDPGTVFRDVDAAGQRRDLELAAAEEAISHAPHLPAGVGLFLKFESRTVATGRISELLDDELAPRIVVELGGQLRAMDSDAFWRAVQDLRDRGVRFAMDETGTGFGSLSHVFKLAPAFVRLPGDLTRAIDSDRTRRALVGAATSFASHFGARVVADAVETAEELDALRRLRVHYALGWHIGRPAPLPEAAGATGDAEADSDAGTEADAAQAVLQAPRQAHPDVLALVPPRSMRSVAATARAVLALIGQELTGCSVLLGLVDAEHGMHRVVETAGEPGVVGTPGCSRPLAATAASRMLAGDLPQIVHDLRAPVSPPELEGEPGDADAGEAGVEGIEGAPEPPWPTASSWLCVPLALRDGTVVATVEAAALEPGRFDREALLRVRDLAAVVLQGLISHYGDDDAATMVTTLRDLAWSDPLTGLLNPPRFAEILERVNARNRRGSDSAFLVLASLNNGDAIARRIGQGVSDLLLKDIATAFERHAGPRDTFGRIGPYRLAGILFGRSEAAARLFCRQIEAEIAESGKRRAAMPELSVGQHRLGAGEALVAVVRQAAAAST